MTAEPSVFRRAAHYVRLTFLDFVDVLLRRRDPLTPSRRAAEYVGGSDFAEIGRHLAEVATALGEMKPTDTILDAGCGYGRLAVALARRSRPGSYLGFDISRDAIQWCREHIQPRFPNFQFRHADVRNTHYNVRGRIEAEAFPFPAPSSSIDVVFAASLFTHLQREAVANYLRESSRVLKDGGRFVASFFILKAESLPRVRGGETEPPLTIVDADVAVQSLTDPEKAIAFSEEWLRSAIQNAGLQIVAIHPGAWRSRQGLSYQDFVVAVKGSRASATT